jgi:tetratricopeptide (TPR) repeat protein
LNAFFYLDDPTWVPTENPDRVVVGSTDTSAIPQEIDNPGGFNLEALEGDALARVSERTDTILSLDISAEAQAFALSSYYRSEDMLFDAIGVLSATDLGCTERSRTVELSGNTERTFAESPVVYLRLGEMYQMLGQRDDAERYYRCSADLATNLQDPANAALANARLANIAQDAAQATEFYQNAINNYMALDATTNANAMLEICGLRNCTLPGS